MSGVAARHVAAVMAELRRVEDERDAYPTVRELAARISVSVSQTHAALAYLERTGAVERHGGWGLRRRPA